MIESDSIPIADKHARTHARDKGAAPHWVRCNRMRVIDGISYRCLSGDGHTGPHTFVDEAEHDAPKGDA